MVILKDRITMLEPQNSEKFRLRRANVLILKDKMTLLERKHPQFFRLRRANVV